MTAMPAMSAPDIAGPPGLPRLLAGVTSAEAPSTLDQHLAVYGQLPQPGAIDLPALVEASGLQGRGGAGFPTSTKLRAVGTQRGRPIVVANGAEGEPVSGKDKVLVRYLPHLVLDGTAAAAQALGAREAIVTVSRADREGLEALSAAIDERRARLDARVRLRAVAVPDGFVVGEETALVQFLNRGVAKPTFTPPLPFERGVGRAPTLVQNVETLAQLALIARFGPEWFRTVGTADEPGSALVTISGSVAEPGVYEVALGTPLKELVAQAGGVTEHVRAFLVGGFFGSWLGEREAADACLLEADLRPRGARLGARAIVVLPRSACGICETARAMRYLAGSSAGQCGPCVHGLDAIARAFERLAARQGRDEREQLRRWISQVRGRGACSHPDGAAAFATSALEVFAPETDLHLRGRCEGQRRVLPVPAVNNDRAR
jgi:NADH:ubiquinone oxidoreductase subunit F (NADH-binding)